MVDSQARIALARGDAAEAIHYAEEALALARESENLKASVDALLTIARARTALGDGAGSLAANEEAADLARTVGSPSLVRKATRDLADALAATGDHERAFALMREALAASSSRKRSSSTHRPEVVRGCTIWSTRIPGQVGSGTAMRRFGRARGRRWYSVY